MRVVNKYIACFKIYLLQIIHRDIKYKNIIRRSKNNKLLLVDFGYTKYPTTTAISKIGTAK
ncbi:MAG: hypothetical protein J7F05_08165 [Trichodesmium erythraeum GBRTRLIN201]|nr:hypothetical protein [Trichodesmium erythraeum GBRTRLIN201]